VVEAANSLSANENQSAEKGWKQGVLSFGSPKAKA
jgi:hypothetical protein